MERIEAEIIYTPVAAFRFWEQQDFKELLNEVMDKSAFFKFSPEEEKVQGISYLLIEMFKIRRQINLFNRQPDIASKFFDQKWNKPITGYRIIKSMCRIKCAGIKKMFKELPVFYVKMMLQRQQITWLRHSQLLKLQQKSSSTD